MSTEFSALGEYNAHLEESAKAASEQHKLVKKPAKNDVSARVDRIMEYLREAETGVTSALHKTSARKEDPPSEKDNSNIGGKLLLDHLTSKLVGQQVELEESKKSLSALTKDHKRLKDVIKEQTIQQYLLCLFSGWRNKVD